MLPADARAYKKRWELVADVEREALARMTPEEKLAQLSTLMETARRMGWETHTAAEIDGVRTRWNRLVEIWNERHSSLDPP